MTIVVFGLITLSVLMLVAALAVPLARRVALPVPVLFAALGLIHGLGTTVLGIQIFSGALDSYDQWFVAQLALDSEAMLHVFLPPLLFEMALAVNVRRLLEDAPVVLVMAILAVAAATASIGLLLWLATPLGLVVCLLLGAAVATTDPGAVISTFREIGAPRRLLTILEGESLLNDAAAIAIFGLLLGVLREAVEPNFVDLGVEFLYSFAAGAAVGVAMAWIALMFYPRLAASSAAEVSVTIALAYGSFIAAEQAVGGSGVVAVVFAGLTTGSTSFTRMGPGNWMTVRAVWTQIGFWSNALIMLLATSLVPGLISELGWRILPLVLLVYVAAMAARAAIIFGLVPLMAAARLTTPLTRAQSLLITWGGVRGSVTLVLALSIADLTILGGDAKLMAALAAGYTILTIFLNAATLAWLTRRLGLNRLSPGELALRERILAGALERVRNVVRNLARARHFETDALALVEQALGAQRDSLEAAAARQAGDEEISLDERLKLGVSILAGQEARLIRRAFEDGAIGPRSTAALRLEAERIADGARAGGRAGYRAAVMSAIQPQSVFRAAVLIRRFFGLDRPLRRAIELHLIMQLESELIVRNLSDFIRDTLAPMVGDDAAVDLTQLMAERHAAVNLEIEAIGAQYPRYAKSAEQTLVARAALRRERHQYLRLLNDGVISQELHDNLSADLDRRERTAATPPRLDLTLAPKDLLDRARILAGLDARQRRRVARALRTRFTVPGQIVRAPAERGSAMFFIASGAFEITHEGESWRLGTGDFFGESALVQPLKPIGDKVVSLGYCRLLAFRRRDFRRLAKRDPTIERIISDAVGRGPPRLALPPPTQPGAATAALAGQ